MHFCAAFLVSSFHVFAEISMTTWTIFAVCKMLCCVDRHLDM